MFNFKIYFNIVFYRLNHFQSIWHLWRYFTQFYANVVNMGHVGLMCHTIGEFKLLERWRSS
jgi:hypothetical protein